MCTGWLDDIGLPQYKDQSVYVGMCVCICVCVCIYVYVSMFTGWLDDIGLPQYKDQFTEARLDGRMLHYLTIVSSLVSHLLSNHT